VMRSDGAPYGKKAREEFPQRPAQPTSDTEFSKVQQEDSTLKTTAGAAR